MTQTDPAETFRLEAQDVLEQLEQALLDLGDRLDDMALVDAAFRALHTIKGSGAMFGFTEVAQFVHEFETAFDRVRKGDAAPSDELVRVALDAKDHIALLIAEPNTHAEAGEPILNRLRASVGPDAPVVDQRHAADTAISAGDRNDDDAPEGWHIRFRLPEDALSLGANPLLLLDELRKLGDCKVLASTQALPPLEQLDPEICYLSWEVTLESGCPRDAIEDVFLFVREGAQLDINAMPATGANLQSAGRTEPLQTAEPVARKPDKQSAPARENSSLRVAAERLDELLDRVGELVIAQARLSQIAEESSNPNLMAVTEEIERLSAGLRDTTMGIRMVPIGSLFSRFRRLVHDLSSELGKDVEFVTSGEQTELDKTVIEHLADPLVHVIRNAIDHGLENPDARSAAGKPRQGTVRLSAAHEGAEVAITVSDDGAGLDTDRIRQKAVDSGLIPPDATLPEAEVNRLIFHPGFSTAQEVSAISGRGVGMDVVSRTMDSLRGRIDVASQRGEGSTITLRLPLTLAIIDGMLVRVGANRYAIPLSAVEECVELPAKAAEGSRRRNFLSIRDKLVPFLRLRELFGTQEPEDLHQKVVIVSTGEQRVGLVVDQILGNTQTVIKSLSRLHADVEAFAGATIMGDGTVALILDVAHLVRSGQRFETRLRDEQRKGQAA